MSVGDARLVGGVFCGKACDNTGVLKAVKEDVTNLAE